MMDEFNVYALLDHEEIIVIMTVFSYKKKKQQNMF